MPKLGIELLIPLTLLLAGIPLTVPNGYGYTWYSAGVDQTSSEKAAALLFLGNVARIDIAAYNTSLTWQAIPPSMMPIEYPGHTETRVEVRLENDKGSFKAEIEFLDGEFLHYWLYHEDQGGTIVTKSHYASVVDLAKFALERYGADFDASHCRKLEVLLDETRPPNPKRETSGPEISQQEISADYAVLTFSSSSRAEWGEGFRWRFAMNNVISPEKTVSMHIDYQNGQSYLSAFGDNWRHYEIGSATVNVSREEATNTALSILNTDADKMSLTDIQKETVKAIQKQVNEEGAKTTCEANLLFGNSPSGDCLTLDAMWSVIVSYDKIYSPWETNGFEVDIWADTGRIFSVTPRGIMGDSDHTVTPNMPSPLVWFAVAAVALSVPVTALTIHRKRRHHR
jgi:hypothetical protein